MKKSEIEIVRELRSRFSLPSELGIGIGDDAAFLSLKKSLLITTDLMIEGVDFELSYFSPYHLGFKIVSVNVSDIFAMGGDFVAFLLSLGIPENFSDDELANFFEGVDDALKTYRGYLAGGDISKSDRVVLSGIAVGESDKPVLRKGAQPNDRIFITAPTGLSSAGFHFLQKLSLKKRALVRESRGSKDFLILNQEFSFDLTSPILRHLMPTARDSQRFRDKSKAMIDISDGLLIDLHRLCEESKVGAKLYLEKIPVDSSVKKIGEILGIDYLNFVLSGGEDYELLVVSDCDLRSFGLIEIGVIVEERGLFIIDHSGKRTQVEPKGWQHFLG